MRSNLFVSVALFACTAMYVNVVLGQEDSATATVPTAEAAAIPGAGAEPPREVPAAEPTEVPESTAVGSASPTSEEKNMLAAPEPEKKGRHKRRRHKKRHRQTDPGSLPTPETLAVDPASGKDPSATPEPEKKGRHKRRRHRHEESITPAVESPSPN
ncbi:MAG: hypothetical protein LBD15_01345 [Holosporales bacterium]|nr:hypothetical protein [Holosporales bacterium]